MDKIEAERLVADAILLERAARVLDRRKREPGRLVDRIEDDAMAFKLRRRASQLRQVAGQTLEEIRDIRASRD